MGVKFKLRLSASQIKVYCGSRAKRVGKCILGIKDDGFSEDALALGTIGEERIMTGKDRLELLDNYNLFDPEVLLEKYENIKHNSSNLDFKIGDRNVKVEGQICGEDFLGYLDNYNPDCIDDIKTVTYLTKPDGKAKNFWSGMTYIEEYELQLRIYMSLTGINKSRIIEVSKHKYKDDRIANQIIEFEMTEEFDKRMRGKYFPIIKEMRILYNKYKTK